jgi:hypothetical protein
MPNFNTIQTIKNYFDNHNGVQLTNRFIVNFYNLPADVWSGNLELTAEALTIGPRSISTIQDGLMGFGGGRYVPRSQMPFSGPYGAAISFPVTNDNYILNFFNRWFNKFYAGPVNSNNPFIVPYYDDSVRNVRMEVQVLDPNGNPNSIITFHEVFPIESYPLEFNMASTDKYLRYAIYVGFRDTYYNFNV